MFYEVIVSRIFLKATGPDSGILTYSHSEKLKPGTIITVPLGRSTVPAIVYRKVAKPQANFKIKPITSILYTTPLPSHLLKSILWLSKYYLTPLPQTLSLLLPTGITKNRRKKTQKISSAKPNEPNRLDPEIPLNPYQKRALQELKFPQSQTNTKLLHGVTGSGKTNIYLTLAKQTFSKNQSTILLVPEIALTSQLVQIFQKTFGDSVVLIHSKQTEASRHRTWEELLLSPDPKIIIGPRSALLAPVKELSLIIIDEAHESTYYQEQPPKYNALRLASFIAKTLNIPCIYGTATPLLSDYHLAKNAQSYVALQEKAKSSAISPHIQVIDLTDRTNFSKNRYFSNQLLSSISKNLEQHQQTLIFHNRRGTAPLTICESCGWQALCPTCFLPLTLHTDSFNLICHTCGYNTKVPNKCPECEHLDIIHKGFGTKLLESNLKKLFKDAHIARFDTDNDKNNSLESLYSEVKSGNIDIIIGTQTIARGFDFPSLATVGVVQADAGLSLPDYSAEERTFHLLTQVIGRVGRGHLETADVIIQTFQPNHPLIAAATNNNYSDFASYLLKKRRKAHLPPFYFLARLSLVYKTEKTTVTKIKQLHNTLQSIDSSSTHPPLIISQPTPSFHERTSSGFSWQIILKSTSRTYLLEIIQNIIDTYPTIRLTLDPPSLL